MTGLVNEARHCLSPNHDERQSIEDIDLIVLHNISLPPNEYGGPWIDALFTNELPKDEHPFFDEIHTLRVSSHVLIRRTGELVQYVPFHKRAWHAGQSCFQGRDYCNDFSIGIELEGTDFEPFEADQYHTLEHLLNILMTTYNGLSESRITGHEHIAPGRKTDPGPYFNWEQLSQHRGQHLPAHANAQNGSLKNINEQG